MVYKAWSSLRFVGAAALVVAMVSGCGGGSTASTPTLSGVAAIGVPIVAGSINVTCTGGSAQTTTSTTGGWTVSTSGLTLPCAVRVSGGTVSGVANTTAYHSVALSSGTVNVTPLTDLVVAQMLGSSPATWFATPVFTSVNSTALSAALNTVSTNLGISTTLGSVNPLTASFVAQNGDTIDDVLEAIKTALTSQTQTYADLLAAAQANNYASVNGFGTAFSTAYSTVTASSGSGGSSGSASCSSGQTSLVFTAATNATSHYSTGQTVCFTASTTALAFLQKALSNPVQNTQVQSPYSAYTFTDTSDSYNYEVVFNAGALYEINVLNGTTYVGGFAL